MSSFLTEKLIPLSVDAGGFDLFTSRIRDIQYCVPTQMYITVDASTEANLPGIAHKFLQDYSLWFVLMVYNGIVDPIGEVSIGTKIAIPKKRSLMSFLEGPAPSVSETVLVF